MQHEFVTINIAFGDILLTQISTAVTSKATHSLISDTRGHLSSFPNKFPSTQGFEDIDRCGTNIWNLCVRLRRDTELDATDEIHEIIFLARVFAFLLLDCAHQCGSPTSENLPRLMKTGIKSGKSCIGNK